MDEQAIEKSTMENKQNCALITGVSGFIGRELFLKIKHLDPIGVKNSSKMAFRDGKIIKMNLIDKNQVATLFNKYDPDIIYHFAALTSPTVNEEYPELAKKSHLDITSNIIENIPSHTHLIYLSTDKVFDGSHSKPDEEEATNPTYIYGKLKLLCENKIKKNVQKYHILRLPIVHSLGVINSNSFIDKALINIKKGKKVNVYNNVFRCYVLISDLIDLLEKLADDTNYGVYNVGTDMMSYSDRLQQLCLGLHIDYEKYLFQIKGNVKPLKQNLNTEKARNTFNINFS